MTNMDVENIFMEQLTALILMEKYTRLLTKELVINLKGIFQKILMASINKGWEIWIEQNC